VWEDGKEEMGYLCFVIFFGEMRRGVGSERGGSKGQGGREVVGVFV